MPVKRRLAKRRVDERAECEAWRAIFESGFAFDGDLRAIGLASDDPDRTEIKAAWDRLGARFIAEHGGKTDIGRPLWALRELGEPARAS